MKEEKNIVIVGAGITGLICALELEANGMSPTIIEKSSSVGGRVKTDYIDDMAFDHGFQVLLTAYPAAQKYLNSKALKLRTFLPGALIYHQGKVLKFGDFLRAPTFAIPTTFSAIGTITDKWKVYQLSNHLKRKSIDQIFSEKEMTTLSYLKEYGFSDRIINKFFKPFYSGIFLETDLSTSSRMFEFVFKMFAEGKAAIPLNGIQEVANQIASKLNKTTMRFNSEVIGISDQTVAIKDASDMKYDHLVIATDPRDMVNAENQMTEWKACINLYFESEHPKDREPIIRLIADSDTLINNFHYVTDVLNSKQKAVISVTVIGSHNLNDEDLIDRVKMELKSSCGIDAGKLLKRYDIQRALPNLSDVKYRAEKSLLEIAPNVIAVGDFAANGSLNAAMESGAMAAQMIIQKYSED